METANSTHEPDFPLPGWPLSHVAVDLTESDEDECVVVTIHGVAHHLHSTTARALHHALRNQLTLWGGEEWVEETDL